MKWKAIILHLNELASAGSCNGESVAQRKAIILHLNELASAGSCNGESVA